MLYRSYNIGAGHERDHAQDRQFRRRHPAEGVLDRLNFKAGDQLEVKQTGSGLTLEPMDDSFERQMKAAREVMDKYKVALQKLAK